ncbi:hypothetical protein MFLO_11485 [Listeria floridensis FSL S10-1187]|uniref:DUF3324 domain-containing protein n=1 Tax=Listeria floridensis FSL S10-1187 TaxID=1265817 RepID=A0ABN0RDT7_9LIST|nr:DUF916 and DUF3324 domain-containing protein [Listeria floridensis]EUJ29202.1 hypothetical protein MFLO_11485 [Listeria floridensis FSL S10-1187]
MFRRGLFGIGFVILMSMTWLGFAHDAAAAEMDFSVEAILDGHQAERGNTYFDLLVKPEETVMLAVRVSNHSDTAKEIGVYANTAVTNDNGVIEYANDNPKLDASLEHPFSSLVAVPSQRVTLVRNETKRIEIPVRLPKKAFSGTILGGLYFVDETDSGKVQDSDEGVQIHNRFSYTIGVVLRENERKVEPDLKLKSVKAGQKNGRNTIFIGVQNDKPEILRNLVLSGQIFREGGEKPLQTFRKENVQMAPNSLFNYGVSQENQAFQPGNYLLKLEGKANGKTWKFTKKFTISKDEAKRFNDQAVELEESGISPWLYALIGAGVLFVAGFSFWAGKRARRS